VVAELKRETVSGFALVANLSQKGSVVRKYDQLLAAFASPNDLMHGLATAERILAGKWIVENHYALRSIGITLKMGDEYCEGQGASVAGAQRVSEAGFIGRRFAVAEIYARVIDNKLVGRTGNAAAVRRPCLRDREPGIKIVEQLIDPALVRLHHFGGMRLQFRAYLNLLLVESGLLLAETLMVRA
jgi:hypothetical protein